MQTEFKEVIFELAKEMADLSKLQTVILFGSIAKGEADKRSDIDVMVVFDVAKSVDRLKEKKEIAKIALSLEKKHGKSIQLVFTNKNFNGLDRQFIETVMKEGIVLYGNIPRISTGKLSLEPFFLINYNTKNVGSREKMKLNRALFGYETKKTHKNKEYKTKAEGLVKEFDAKKIGLATILVPSKKAKVFTNLLDSLNIKYSKLDVWISKT